MKQLPAMLKTGVLSAFALALVAAPAFAATTTIVNPDNMNGWVDASVSGGTVQYVEGAPDGMGQESLKLSTSAENASKAVYVREESMPLKEVTAASYWTKQYMSPINEGSASYFMTVDLDNNGSWDTNLVHEPYWQNDESPDADPVKANEWQKWDVANGIFWSSKDFTGTTLNLKAGAGGPPFYTLADIKSAFPDAKLVGIGVNVGSWNPSYVIGVDGVMINDRTYNFGRVNSVDTKLPVSKDDCKKNSWKSLTMSDGTTFKNQGQCVSYVATGQAAQDSEPVNRQQQSYIHLLYFRISKEPHENCEALFLRYDRE